MRAILLGLIFGACCGAAPFQLLTVNPPVKGCGARCVLNVVTAGVPAGLNGRTAEQVLSSKETWQVRVFQKQEKEMVAIPFQISDAKASATGIGTSVAVDLAFAETELGGADPRSLRWSVLYQGSGDFQLASIDPQVTAPAKPGGGPAQKNKILAAAESRDKADLYFSGNILAGVATKPIYTLDAKVNFAPPLNWHGVHAGVYGEVQSNPNSTPPNDKSEVDPDSIRAYATINGLWKNMYWDVRPAGGEFSRKYPASSFVPTLNAAWWRQATQVPGGWFVIYPSLAVELGVNLNKPAILFQNAVDLSRYNNIRRVVPGVNASYFLWGTQDKPKATITGTYQARLLLTDEPFTQLAYYRDSTGIVQRGKVVQMRDNARHWVDASATWTLNDYFGLTAEYKYGSLPPLFELTQHQVTFGLVYKASLWPRQ
jgi:hypothetical protein